MTRKSPELNYKEKYEFEHNLKKDHCQDSLNLASLMTKISIDEDLDLYATLDSRKEAINISKYDEKINNFHGSSSHSSAP